ncbi:MAG: hypothetical protein WCE30_22545 [Mycobacterium sp.]
MRFVATLLLWLVTTAALAIAVPVTWAQHTVVSRSGYTTLATKAAKEPSLQGAVAGELATQLNTLATKAGYGTSIDVLSAAANAYAGSSVFPGQFGTVNGLAHDWLFTDTAAHTDSSGHWVVDLSPMLSDSSLKETLTAFGVKAPSKLQVPVTDSAGLRPGQFRVATTWGPWASVGACVLAGFLAFLTLGLARSRGKTLAALGISAMLVGASGWAGIEVGRPRVNDALNRTSGNMRQVADVMTDYAISDMHHWLNITLLVGAGLVAVGVLLALIGGLLRKRKTEPRKV